MEFLINKETWSQPDHQTNPAKWGNWNHRVGKLVVHYIENPKDAFCGRIMLMLIAAYPGEMRRRVEEAVNAKYRRQLRNLQQKIYKNMGIGPSDDYSFLAKNGVKLDEHVLFRDGLSDAANEFLGSKPEPKNATAREYSYLPNISCVGWTTSFNGARYEVMLIESNSVETKIIAYINSKNNVSIGDLLYRIEKKYGFDFKRGSMIATIEYKSSWPVIRLREFCLDMKIKLIHNETAMFHPEKMVIYLKPEFGLEKK
jgi:hypothetical protein